jgi:hypothetical protein
MIEEKDTPADVYKRYADVIRKADERARKTYDKLDRQTIKKYNEQVNKPGITDVERKKLKRDLDEQREALETWLTEALESVESLIEELAELVETGEAEKPGPKTRSGKVIYHR